MVKYDMDKGDIVWATELDSTAAAGAPVIDNWGQVIFRYVWGTFFYRVHVRVLRRDSLQVTSYRQ